MKDQFFMPRRWSEPRTIRLRVSVIHLKYNDE
jgi:hypothetical protein